MPFELTLKIRFDADWEPCDDSSTVWSGDADAEIVLVRVEKGERVERMFANGS